MVGVDLVADVADMVFVLVCMVRDGLTADIAKMVVIFIRMVGEDSIAHIADMIAIFVFVAAVIVNTDVRFYAGCVLRRGAFFAFKRGVLLAVEGASGHTAVIGTDHAADRFIIPRGSDAARCMALFKFDSIIPCRAEEAARLGGIAGYIALDIAHGDAVGDGGIILRKARKAAEVPVIGFDIAECRAVCGCCFAVQNTRKAAGGPALTGHIAVRGAIDKFGYKRIGDKAAADAVAFHLDIGAAIYKVSIACIAYKAACILCGIDRAGYGAVLDQSIFHIVAQNGNAADKNAGSVIITRIRIAVAGKNSGIFHCQVADNRFSTRCRDNAEQTRIAVLAPAVAFAFINIKTSDLFTVAVEIALEGLRGAAAGRV